MSSIGIYMEGGGPTRSSGRAALRQGMAHTTRFIMRPIYSSDSLPVQCGDVVQVATGFSQPLIAPCRRTRDATVSHFPSVPIET